jgi:hypothetical protein
LIAHFFVLANKFHCQDAPKAGQLNCASGDIFEGDVTKHPTVHRKPYNHPTQNVTDVEIDKLCSKYILSSVEKIF